MELFGIVIHLAFCTRLAGSKHVHQLFNHITLAVGGLSRFVFVGVERE